MDKSKINELKDMNLFDLLDKGETYVKKAGYCNNTSSAIYLPKKFTNKWLRIHLVPLESNKLNVYEIKSQIANLSENDRKRLFGLLEENEWNENQPELETSYRPKKSLQAEYDKTGEVINIVTTDDGKNE